MPAPVRVDFEIDGEIFRHDANPAVLRIRRTVTRGLRESWPRERIIQQTLIIGKFKGSAELTPGVAILNGRENYYWTLTLRQCALREPPKRKGRASQ
jgi:hypothetical protein